jgi:alkylhydroperoxidase/carboxymuconolactone decarboxylase family protein YurZ
MIPQTEIDRQAAALLDGVADGDGLDELTATIVGTAVRASAMALDVDGTREWMSRALALGATRDQLQEAVTLVSGMGVHAFFEASRTLDALTDAAAEPLDERRQGLWDQYVGTSNYWDTMRQEIPGFLESLLRMSPEAFEAFFVYCAVPFRSRNLTNLQKELISVAADASPSHRYLPGMRLHIRNALKLGAGRKAIEQVLRIAAASPEHRGVA